MYCEMCGKEIKGEEKFCPQCGNPIKAAENIEIVETKVPAESSKYKKTIKWKGKATAAMLLVAAIVVATVFVQNRKEDDVLYAMPYQGKWGWVNEKKEFIIKPQYEYAVASNFKDRDWAAVAEGDGYGGYRYGIINKNNEYIIPAEYNTIRPLEEGKNIFVVSKYMGESYVKDTAAVEQGGSGMDYDEAINLYEYSLIDNKGNQISKQTYKRISPFDDDGMTIVQDRQGYFGYINSDGEEVVNCGYADLGGCIHSLNLKSEFSKNGLVFAGLRNGEYGYINRNGDVVIDFGFTSAKNFSENGLAAVAVENKQGEEKYGYINEKGEVVIDFQFDYADTFSENGLAVVIMTDRFGKSKCGYINEKGEVVIGLQFTNAGDFSENGLAAVAVENKQGEEKYGYINERGEVVIDFQYGYAGRFSKDGLAAVEMEIEEGVGIINEQGQWVLPCEYDNIEPVSEWYGEEYKGLYLLTKNWKKGVVDKQGNIIVECDYSRVEFIKDKIAVIKENDESYKIEYGLKNLDGTWFVESTEDNWYYNVPKQERESWQIQ